MTKGHNLARSWATALTATGVGALSHVAAGGHLPHPIVLTLATSLAALITLGLNTLKLPAVSLAAGVAVGQGLLHLLYSHGHAVAPLSASHHLHAAPGSDPTLMQAQGTAGTLETAAHTSPLMWLAHTLAAALTYSVLVYGERIFYLLKALLATIHLALRVPTVQATGYRPKPQLTSAPVHPLQGVCAGLSGLTRGPPALTVH